MGDYGRIQNIIEGSTLEYASLKIVPRGTPIFPDILMKGEMRFARRLGANFAVMTPDNIMRLSTEVLSTTTIIPVNRTLLWLEANALVTFNGIEMYEIADWSDTERTVILRQPLSKAEDAGAVLNLWATPLVVHSDAPEGISTISVRSRYNLLNGDTITFPVNTLLNSLMERNVLVAQDGGPSGDPDYPYLYALTLDRPMPIPLLENNSSMYLRAYPGYLSPTLRVPKLQAPSQIGPFLVDYLSSPLDSVVSYPETFAIRTFDGGGGVIEGTVTQLNTVEKNTPVEGRPIWAENLLYWKVLRGSGGFTYPNRYRMLTDQTGRGRIKTDLVPEFKGGFGWTVKATSTANGIFRVCFFINNQKIFQDFSLTANDPTLITFSIPAGQTATRVDFICKLLTEGEVVLQDANTAGALVASVQYSLVHKVMGDSNFQSTSLIVKPYFFSLADLASRYNEDKTYNSGFIYL